MSFSRGGRRPRRHLDRDAKLILRSPLFDVAWCAAQQRKLKGDRLDIALHYLKKDAPKGHNPSPSLVSRALPGRRGQRYQSFDPLHKARVRRSTGNSAGPQSCLAQPGADASASLWLDESLSAPGSSRHTRVVWISGKPDTPGHHYRVARHGGAAAPDVSAPWMRADEVPDRSNEIRDADVLVIWRAAWDEHVAAATDLARRAGVRVVFDVDDLMFEPDLARLSIIDGIRSQSVRGGLHENYIMC